MNAYDLLQQLFFSNVPSMRETINRVNPWWAYECLYCLRSMSPAKQPQTLIIAADAKHAVQKHIKKTVYTLAWSIRLVSSTPWLFLPPSSLPSHVFMHLSSWGCGIKNGWLLSATGIYLCKNSGEKAWRASISGKHSQLTGLIPSTPQPPLAVLQTGPI